MRKTTRALVALLMFSATMTAVPASGEPRHGATIAPLGRITKIQADESAWMRVRLGRDVPLFPSMPATVKFEGNGRALAILLVREKADGTLDWSQNLSGHHLGQCAQEACAPKTLQRGWLAARGAGRRPTLRAGTYRLYVVTDGAPITVTLGLGLLEGRTTLRPTQPATTRVKTLTPRLHETTTGMVYSAGDVSPFRGGGLSLVGLWVKGVEDEHAVLGDCIYEDEPPTIETIAYLPEVCPTTYYRGIQSNGSTDPDNYDIGFNLALDYIPAALGTWYASRYPVEDAGSVALWLKTP